MYITGYKMVLDLMQKRPEMAEEKINELKKTGEKLNNST